MRISDWSSDVCSSDLDLFGEFFSEIIRGIDLVAHESGMHLLLGNMHGSTHETAAAIAAMRGRVDGLLVMPPDLKPELLADYLDPALPTVLLNYAAGSLDQLGRASFRERWCQSV